MASRSSSTRKSSPESQQKQRSAREAARAGGGGLRITPAEKPAGPSASTGGRATRALVRNSANSRSSNAGKKK